MMLSHSVLLPGERISSPPLGSGEIADLVSESADGGFIRPGSGYVHSKKELERDAVIDLGLSLRIGQIEPLLEQKNLEPEDRIKGGPSSPFIDILESVGLDNTISNLKRCK